MRCSRPPRRGRRRPSYSLGVRDGEDPTESRVEALAAPSVADLAERFLRDQSAKKKTGAEDRRILGKFLSAAELTRLGAALRAAEGRIGSGRVAALRLLILTGARRGEVLNLRWEEVDLEAGLLRLTDSKTGAKVIP